MNENSNLSLHTAHTLHLRRVLKRSEYTVACWEITFVTITIAQSSAGDVIDIFVLAVPEIVGT